MESERIQRILGPLVHCTAVCSFRTSCGLLCRGAVLRDVLWRWVHCFCFRELHLQPAGLVHVHLLCCAALSPQQGFAAALLFLRARMSSQHTGALPLYMGCQCMCHYESVCDIC